MKSEKKKNVNEVALKIAEAVAVEKTSKKAKKSPTKHPKKPQQLKNNP